MSHLSTPIIDTDVPEDVQQLPESTDIGKVIPFNSELGQAIVEMIVGPGASPTVKVFLKEDPPRITCAENTELEKLLLQHSEEIIALAKEKKPIEGMPEDMPVYLDAYTFVRKFNLDSSGTHENSFKGCEFWLSRFYGLKPGQTFKLSREVLCALCKDDIETDDQDHLLSLFDALDTDVYKM